MLENFSAFERRIRKTYGCGNCDHASEVTEETVVGLPLRMYLRCDVHRKVAMRGAPCKQYKLRGCIKATTEGLYCLDLRPTKSMTILPETLIKSGIQQFTAALLEQYKIGGRSSKALDMLDELNLRVASVRNSRYSGIRITIEDISEMGFLCCRIYNEITEGRGDE